MAKYQTHQLITKHSSTCLMQNGFNPGSPWCLPEHVTDGFLGRSPVGRDLTGRRNPRAGHSWMLFRCADSDCPAQLAIYWPTIERALGLNDAAWKMQENPAASDGEVQR
jgi:hypothetical protein